ncbi:DUF4245 domain-containing protein [Streptomyces sp. 549]|uniref:DUF4245 domain-containing protein n=1 Tax=Streptomyces sp. 549 TaxID=3049076 RepID=UPI0032E35F91
MATKRGLKTVRDMVLSMAVIGLGAWFLYLFLPNDDQQDPVREVSYRTELVTAERAAPYGLAAPEGLPASWRATSVFYKAQSDHGAVWHLGFMDPDNEYAAVEQSDADPRRFVAKVTHRAEATEQTEQVNGEEWVYHEGVKYDALVLEQDGVTTVVTGTAPRGRLVELASALRTERPGNTPDDGQSSDRPARQEAAGDTPEG